MPRRILTSKGGPSNPKDSVQSPTQAKLAAASWSTPHGQRGPPVPPTRLGNPAPVYSWPPRNHVSTHLLPTPPPHIQTPGQSQLPIPEHRSTEGTLLLLTLLALGWGLDHGGLGLGLQPALQLRHQGVF